VKAEVAGPLTWHVTGALLTVRFTLRNSGRSPALNVWVDWRPLAGIIRQPYLVQQEIMNNARPASAMTVFPDEEEQVKTSMNLLRSDIISDELMDGCMALTVLGCAVYTSPGSVQPHFTGFTYELREKEHANEGAATRNCLPVDAEVSADRLLLHDIRLVNFTPIAN
jgi:hypothetical protein